MYLPLTTIVDRRIAAIRHTVAQNGLVPPSAIGLLRTLLASAWSRETAHPAARAKWSPQQPWLGQSDVTALVVEKIVGHCNVLRALNGSDRPHYLNFIIAPEGLAIWGPDAIVDLTRDTGDSPSTALAYTTLNRIELLDSGEGRRNNTRERYDLLKRRLRQNS